VHQTRPKGNKAFSYLFRTHLAITISAMVSGRLAAWKLVKEWFCRY